MDSTEKKKANPKKGILKWLDDNSKIIWSFSLAFLSIIVGIASNLIADSVLSISWQNLEVIIALMATFLTSALILVQYFQRVRRSDRQHNGLGSDKEGEDD